MAEQHDELAFSSIALVPQDALSEGERQESSRCGHRHATTIALWRHSLTAAVLLSLVLALVALTKYSGHQIVAVGSESTVELESQPCSPFFKAPERPTLIDQHNGVALEDVCMHGDGPFHAFILGDWGALMVHGRLNTAPLLHHRPGHKFVFPVDDHAQEFVRNQMRARAPHSKPDYILNVGDNFFWSGVEDHCGVKDFTIPYSGGGTEVYKSTGKVNQFKVLYEEMYTGPGLDDKPWLGVLGSHDYGGWQMNHAWDQAIGYTWSKVPWATGRWLTPALYWRVTVRYPDFSVDYYFMDTNVWDALPDEQSPQNICGQRNPSDATCPAGLSSMKCKEWFKTLWSNQTQWLDEVVPKSTAHWRIVVTHFPPYWGKECKEDWKHMTRKHEIDLIVTGHRHSQFTRMKGDKAVLIWPEWGPASLKEDYTDFLDPTAWVVSGGGGGVTSEDIPDAGGHDDQYGFMDLTLAKDKLIVEAISHTGVLRRKLVIEPKYPHNPHFKEA